MSALKCHIAAALVFMSVIAAFSSVANADAHWTEPRIPGTSEKAVTLGRDLDGDGDPDEVNIRLEVIEIEEEVYPGKVVTFWVFAPEAKGMLTTARVPSPTIRLEVGDRVRITLLNTHYLPHTIHLHGTTRPNPMDVRPLKRVNPGESFTFEYIATDPGTHFYDCHVLEGVHPPMGLIGMVIIEPNRPNNNFTHLVPGAGRMPDLAKVALVAGYKSEYSLVYMDIDTQLNGIPAVFKDPRKIELRMHGKYKPAMRQPNVFLLNGRSFPFTLQDTPIEVTPGERVKLRVLNAGADPINLHFHGHQPTLTHVYVPLDELLDEEPDKKPESLPATRDMFTIGARQSIDLELRPGSDGGYASGPGVWVIHDHTEQAVTDKGINPGGSLTTIVYDGFMGEDGLPRLPSSLVQLVDRARENGGAAPAREAILDTHQIVAKSCERPRSFRRIYMKAGTKFAGKGEAYAFEPRVIRAEPCEEVEIVLDNTDAVRHAFMLPGLNPMFLHELTGPRTRTARFITPDEDITLEFHCHIETHEKMGMDGILIVGKGGKKEAAQTTAEAVTEKHRYEGIGVIVAVEPRKSRLVLDHQEIKDFMAAMKMSYMVIPATLLQGLEPGDKVRFTIDADKRAIVDVVPLDR